MPNELTVKEFYDSALMSAMIVDPRGKEYVENILIENKKKYEKIKNEREKKYFDIESITNPYVDSRIMCGDIDKKISSIICGIDLEASEILLVDRLNERGMNIGLAITHHPEGHCQANFYEVMEMQSTMMANIGIPINKSEAITKKRMKEISYKISPSNHMRAVDAAKLLNITYASMHTFADNHVQNYLSNLMLDKKPEKLSDILDILFEIEEYDIAAKNNNPPKIFVGSKENRVGKILVDMTGGTTADIESIKYFSSAGVGTLIVMHLPEEHRKECEKEHINVVCAGHIASDSLGLNLMFKSIREISKKDFSVIPCSGLIYVKR